MEPGDEARPVTHDEARYGFEALYRAMVDREKTGFEMCRKAVVNQVTKMRDDTRSRLDGEEWDSGRIEALDEVLKFLLRDA